MVIGDVMSKKVTVVRAETTLRQLWKTIFVKKINAVPVVDARKKMVGIITKDDILTLLYPDYKDLMEGLFSRYDFEEMEGRIHDLNVKRAHDVMCRRVIYTRRDTPIMRALSRMISRSVNQLPVLDAQRDTLVGMVTKGDIFRALFTKHLFAPLTKRKKV